MIKRRAGVIAGTAAAVAALSIGGASLASAAPDLAAPSATTADDSSSDATTDSTKRASSHTAVTGAEADTVIAAVAAVDADATITEVRMDSDGSYDAIGTSDGSRVHYDVSADLATVTEGRGGHGGALGGRGASSDTAVTGAEADTVIAAVAAVDADVTITEVRMDSDGSYDAIGTSDGSRVFYDVSADLATVTEGRGGRGGHAGGRGHGAPGADSDSGVDSSGTTSGSST